MKESCVILADRHPIMLEGIRGILEAEFDNVVMIADRRSLKNTVTKLMPDLVITDISLPATSGANIVTMLKAENPDLKIIAISLYDDADIVKTVLDAGAIGFVIKRTIGEDLVPAVKSVIAGHEFVSPSIKFEVP